MYERIFEFWRWVIVDGMAHYLTCVTLGVAVAFGILLAVFVWSLIAGK